ncbi:unnamed protein product, partial [Polarella glacialis]
VFFTANFALAWSLSMVTFALSLYERRVISIEVRGMLMLGLPMLVFAVIPLHGAVLGMDMATMLTLGPFFD